MIKHVILLAMFITTGRSVSGQVNLNDPSKELLIFVKQIDSLYGRNFLLENGRVFSLQYNNSDGHPFLFENFRNGEIQLYSEKFYNKKLLYDINHDEVIFLKNNKLPIIINNKILRNFSIEEDSFINIHTKDKGVKRGIYQQVYISENFHVLIKWKKQFSKIVNGEQFGRYSSTKSILFIKKNKIFKRIKSKKELLSLFNDKNGEIKNLIKENKLKFDKSNIKRLNYFFQRLDNLLK